MLAPFPTRWRPSARFRVRSRDRAMVWRRGRRPAGTVSSAQGRLQWATKPLGYGVSGTILGIPEQQPLANDEIWRVFLAGEARGRLVRMDRRRNGITWRLLQLHDVSDAQLEVYEAAMRKSVPEREVDL